MKEIILTNSSNIHNPSYLFPNFIFIYFCSNFQFVF
nr:MAG TPA: hypothetical protein [Caudoviricetes sp.]